MMKLLNWDRLMKIATKPEEVDLRELMNICRQVLCLQAVLGVLAFIPAAKDHSIGLDTIGNVVVPVYALRSLLGEMKPDTYRAIRLAAVYWICGVAYAILRFCYSPNSQGLPNLGLRVIISSVQWMAFARFWRILAQQDLKRQLFYLNCVINNASEVVQGKVEEKFDRGPGARILGRFAGTVAAKLVAGKFPEKIAETLVKQLPERMALNGIKVSVSRQFQRGSVIVLQVNIEDVDLRKIVQTKAAKEKRETLDYWLSALHYVLPKRIRTEIDQVVLQQAAVGLVKKLPGEIAAQLREVAGIEVIAEAKSAEEEAEFLFELLRRMDAAA